MGGSEGLLKTFAERFRFDVQPWVEVKNAGAKLSYLSWAKCHQLCAEADPKYTHTVREFPHPETGYCPAGNPTLLVPYLCTPEGYFVEVSVTLHGVCWAERLPVMDNRNNAYPQGKASTRHISDTIKRCFVKACALHGIGLSLYMKETGASLADEVSRRSTPEWLKRAGWQPGWLRVDKHSDFSKWSKGFMAKMNEAGWPYNTVRDYCVAQGWGKPSQWTRKAAGALYSQLTTSDLGESVAAWAAQQEEGEE